MTKAESTEIEELRRPVVTTPSWLGGARRFAAVEARPEQHRDGTCDALYPGAWLDPDGRCLLSAGHQGSHLYRAHGPAGSRQETYQAARDERKRLARLALRRERHERAARIF